MEKQTTKAAAAVGRSGAVLRPFRIEIPQINFEELRDIVNRPLEIYSKSRRERNETERSTAA